MRIPLHQFIVAFTLTTLSISAIAQPKTEKIERLYRFFNVQESTEWRLRAQMARAEGVGRAAAAEALAGMSPEAKASNESKVQEALDRYLATSSAVNPSTQTHWQAFLLEQLNDEELDAVIAFFLSPVGGKFMGAKGVADSIVDSALSRQVSETIRPAFERLQSELQAMR